jgi:tripartite-type tricarboxylate transporter receptor subunit TctC
MIVIWLSCSVVMVSAAQAQAADDENFYAGKRITYLVSGEPGTGYDLYARLIARYMERYLPRTRIRVQNVIVGGGGILVANQVYAANADGLTMATLNSGLIYSQLQQLDGIRFRLQDMTWIGKAGTDPRVIYTGSGSGLTSLQQLLALPAPVLFATVAGVGTSSYTDAVLIAAALGLEARMVTFANSGEAHMSMLRGEVPVRIGSFSSAQRFVTSSGGHILAAVGNSPLLPPDLANTYAHAAGPEGERIMSIMEAVAEFSRFTVMPPGVPAERVATLRSAYMSALADPDLLAEAASLDLPIEAMDGAALQQRIRDVLAQPPAVIELLNATLQVP